MSTLLKTLRGKVTDAYVQLVDHEPSCTLCQVKLPSQSNYNSHTNGENHNSKSNGVIEQMMNEVLSPGIVLKGDNADNTCIYCVLCEQPVSNLFDSSFHDHINSEAHQSKIKWQKDQEGNWGSNDPYKSSFSSIHAENVFLKGVSRAGIIVTKDGLYCCVPCDRRFSNKEQFMTHVKDEKHREWVFNQLLKMMDRIGLSLGIIVENGSLQCKLCNCELASNLSTANGYVHVNSNDPNNAHTANVQKQIDDGLRTFYDETMWEDDSNYDLDDSDYDFYDSDDLSYEFELQAPWWGSEDRGIEYYMAMDAAYNNNSLNDFSDDDID